MGVRPLDGPPIKKPRACMVPGSMIYSDQCGAVYGKGAEKGKEIQHKTVLYIFEKSRIKTQRIFCKVPELVGSPAVCAVRHR